MFVCTEVLFNMVPRNNSVPRKEYLLPVFFKRCIIVAEREVNKSSFPKIIQY